MRSSVLISLASLATSTLAQGFANTTIAPTPDCARSIEFSSNQNNSKDFLPILGVWDLLNFTDTPAGLKPVFSRGNTCWWPSWSSIVNGVNGYVTYTTQDCDNSTNQTSGDTFSLPINTELCLQYGGESVQAQISKGSAGDSIGTNITPAEAPCPECKVVETGPMAGLYNLKSSWDWGCGDDTDRCCYEKDGIE